MIEGNEQHAHKRWYNKLNRQEIQKMKAIHNKETMQRFKFPDGFHHDSTFEDSFFQEFSWGEIIRKCLGA